MKIDALLQVSVADLLNPDAIKDEIVQTDEPT